MDTGGTFLTLMIGFAIPVPAPSDVTEALQSVEITHSDGAPSAFQLSFNADRASAMTAVDFPLILSQLLRVGNRVVVIVTIDSVPHTIIDGLITRQELSHTRSSGMSTISVVGEDVSVAMDLEEFPLEWPGMGDCEMVEAILLKYALFGVIPVVIPTPSSLVSIPLEQTPQQNCTDRSFIRSLAQKHGYVFMVRPGPAPLTNIAYWGPQPRIGIPNPALTVDMGPATNVESISFQYDGLAPTLYAGMTQDDETEFDLPVASLMYTRMPPLALAPAIPFNFPFFRTSIYWDPRYDEISALDLAQSRTNVSMDNVLTGRGEVDTMRYQSVISAPGLIGVRGCGLSYDGIYYVKSVTHKLSRGEYKQNFVLTREGQGSTVPVVIS